MASDDLKAVLSDLGYEMDPNVRSEDHTANYVNCLEDRKFHSFAKDFQFPDEAFFQDDGPHVVHIYTAVSWYGNILLIEKTFDATLFMRRCWKPSMEEVKMILNSKGTHVESNLVEWRPNMEFKNATKVEYESEWSIPELVYNMGNSCFYLLQKAKVSLTCREKYELENFPLDVQDLTIVIDHYDILNVSTAKEIQIEPFSNIGRTGRCDYTDGDEYEFKNFLMEWGLTKTTVKGVLGSSVLELRIKIQRKWQHYFYRLAFVMAIVGFTGILAFRIDLEEDFPDACAFLSTCLLTVVAFMFVIQSTLPAIPYLTLLDYYVYSQLIYVATQMIFMLLIDFDIGITGSFMFWFSLICWFVMHIVFAIWALFAYYKEIRKVNMRSYDIAKEAKSKVSVHNVYWNEEEGKLPYFNPYFMHTTELRSKAE